MSHLLEERVDELVVYVSGLKKTISRKLDDHLFIIDQQNQRLDEQSRLIEELAWQVRDLRASVRTVGEKLKVVEQQQERDRDSKALVTQAKAVPCAKCDYANVRVGGGNGSLRRTSSSIRKTPRITLVNEEVRGRVEILQEAEFFTVESVSDEYEEEDQGEGVQEKDVVRGGSTSSNHHNPRRSVRSSYDDDEGLYEPIEFVGRDYTAPSTTTSTSPTATATPTGSLSTRHRLAKKQQTPLPPTPAERSPSKVTPVALKPFHFPPPPPVDFMLGPVAVKGERVESPVRKEEKKSEDHPELQLRPTKDYPLVQPTRRLLRHRSFSNGETSSSPSSLTIVAEEVPGTEQEPQELVLRGRSSAGEREANSIKRRAYILPSISGNDV